MIRNVDNSTMFRSAPSAAAKRAAPAVTIWAVVVVFPKNEGDGVWKPTVMNNAHAADAKQQISANDDDGQPDRNLS